MKIGILADSHDQVARTAQAVKLLANEGAEALIHCGDYTTPAVISVCAGLPGYFVWGNNDFDEPGLRTAIQIVGGVCLEWGGEISLGGRRIAVTHGDSDREIRRLLTSDPDYLVFGHWHRQTDERRGATRWINPGALYRAAEWTVALLDLETDDLRFLKIDKG